MAARSERIRQLQQALDAARTKVDYETRRKPVDYAKIAVHERRIEDLRDELKIYMSATEQQ